MKSVTKDLGKIMMTMEGEYNSEREYEILSVVSFEDISYISKKNVPINIPVTNKEYWQFFGSLGNTPKLRKNIETEYIEVSYDNGEHWKQLIALSEITGPQGIQGIQGPKGEPAVAIENYITVEATLETIDIADILPSVGSADTVYRVSNWDGIQYNETTYSEYGWYNNTYKKLATRQTGIDNEPIINSQNLVKSGGVATQISQLGQFIENPEFVEVHTDNEGRILYGVKTDGNFYFGAGCPQQVKEYFGSKIAELQLTSVPEILTFLGNIEETTLADLLAGKISVSDFEAGLAFKVDKVEGKSLIDSDVAENVEFVENPEFVEVHTDNEGRILYGVKTDGNFYFGAGCPQQVKEYFGSKIAELQLTSVPEILTFLGNIEETTLADLLAGKISVSDFEAGLAFKVDKVEGKSLIDSDVAENVEFVESPEFIQVTTDSEGKILEGITSEGKKKVMMEIEVVGAEFSSIDDFEMVEMHLDADDKILYGVDTKGKFIADIKGMDELKGAVNSLSKDETYKTVIDYIANKPIYHPIDENGKELPTEFSVLNVDRRAQQLRYTPMIFSSPVPMAADNQYYSAGEHIGIPYTSCMEIDKMVGFDLTILTFMTAVNNPFSMVYTENLRINKSVYGFIYHPEGRVGNIGGWAGVVCNIMENYATGMDIPYDTGMWAYLASIGEFTKIYLQEAQGLHIGDILWQSGHGRLVQTIWRGNKGLVEKVDVATGGSSGSEYLFQTPEEFDTDLANRNGIIYRNNKLYQNINYRQNPFLTLEGETPIPFTYNDDICTYAGDYACFREGYRIVLNYNLKQDKAFESVELYKNDVIYGTYLLSSDTGSYDRGPDNFPAETAALVPSHSFDLSFLNLTYGKYKARLIGNGLTSDYTYFEILDTVVSHQVSNEKDVTINYSSHLGTPYYIRLSKKNGGPKCIYRLTDEDKEKGYCSFNFLNLIKKQYNNFSTDTYIKVYFKGDYGVVTNEPIKLL